MSVNSKTRRASFCRPQSLLRALLAQEPPLEPLIHITEASGWHLPAMERRSPSPVGVSRLPRPAGLCTLSSQGRAVHRRAPTPRRPPCPPDRLTRYRGGVYRRLTGNWGSFTRQAAVETLARTTFEAFLRLGAQLSAAGQGGCWPEDFQQGCGIRRDRSVLQAISTETETKDEREEAVAERAGRLLLDLATGAPFHSEAEKMKPLLPFAVLQEWRVAAQTKGKGSSSSSEGQGDHCSLKYGPGGNKALRRQLQRLSISADCKRGLASAGQETDLDAEGEGVDRNSWAAIY
ncbi:uncharacterized protein LOC128337626 [Hemicordylus capensis]|uniref:uncharacterized protein LOC128337626 n=1 Tax=Hemicordylus capensis TaxID=884348 RepID=UPI0023035A28|nr:uncharacterized protein LOC128337626 [Hemicordylus capensis]